MNLERVKNHFEDEATTYTSHILKFVPQYREQNELMMLLLPFQRAAKIRALDLGAGPGILSELVLREYPAAAVHVFDLAEKMIAVARQHLARYQGRVTFQKGDFATDDFGDGYDLVLSGLSIHHLDNEYKRRIFRRIFNVLRPDGMLLIRDIVRGASEKLNELYDRLWCEYIRSMNEDDKALMDRFHAEDVPAGVEEQLDWLRQAGFVDVGCHWRRLNFAIFGGRKPSLDDGS